MAAIESGWTRFYGLPVPQELAAAATEHMIDTSVEDLVDAHLGINYSYFGAIDKTLSGFVITDDEGDNYTLVDLRDTGQTWWQDHETREIELRGAKTAKPARKVVSTPDLLARYQWLVWQLARPMEQNGKPIQTIDYLVRNGIGRFRHVFPRKEAFEKTFAAELPALAKDPHLAIYWLLHTVALADDDKRAKVVAAIGNSDNELVQAFVKRFGTMPASGDVSIVAGWRERRALAVIYGAFELSDEETYAAALRALELSPSTRSVQTGLQVAAGIERGKLDAKLVDEVLARIPEQTPGTALLRALADKRRGEKSSKHADEFAGLTATSEDAWWSILEALWQIHELAYDGKALVPVTRRLVAHDRYHRRGLQMAMRAAQIAGEPTERIERIEDDLEVSEGVLGPYTRLVEVPDKWQEVIESIIDPAVLRALAWRVLQRVELNKPSGELAAWAAGQMVSAGEEGRALVADAFAKLDAATQESLIQVAGKAIDRADHPLVSVLIAFLDGPEPPENDFGAVFALKRGKEAAIQALAPWFAEPVVFEPIMKALERPAGRTFIELVIGKLFGPFEKQTYVLHKLADKQAIRVAKAMIATKLRHESIHARNTAGHQLYRFDHRGAESFLIDALTDYGVQNAAQKNENMVDLVANLYSAVRNMKTPAARTALVERLFAERREYWRMGNALGDIFSAETHAETMKLLAERKDARAAGCYAYALHDFVKKGPPLVDLTRMIIEWQGDNETTRGFLHYALIVGMIAALDARDYDLVKRAHDAASWISDPPLEPDDYARGRGWKSPLEDAAIKARLDDVLSGRAEEAKRKLQEAAEASRKTGKPNTKINDEALGQLADATVLDRVMTDPKTGEVWFRDGEKRVRYFDGYNVVDAPFTSKAIGHEGAAAELEDAGSISERALAWDKKAENFRDVLRLGRHVLLSWGVNNGQFERYAITFGDADAASAFTAKLRANPPKGYAPSEPYYVGGKGAVVRTYYAPKEGGGERERRLLWLLDSAVSDEEFGDGERAVAEHLRREAAWLRGGGVMSTLEWSEGRRRREDMTVREWIKDRIRDDRRDARWHLAALTEIADYLKTHGLAPKGLVVSLGEPASADEVAAYAASRKQPLPESLRALWLVHREASWSLGNVGMQFLAPRVVEQRRPKAGEAGDALLEKLPPDAATRSAPLYGALDIIVETNTGEPVTFLADVAREDGRVFSHAADHPNDFWWEVSLSWMLATRLLARLEEAIADAVPEIDTLKFGERATGKKPPATKPSRKPATKPVKKPVRKPTKKPTSKAAKPKAKTKAVAKPKAAAKKPTKSTKKHAAKPKTKAKTKR
jgi:hypothetical protein